MKFSRLGFFGCILILHCTISGTVCGPINGKKQLLKTNTQQDVRPGVLFLSLVCKSRLHASE